METTLKIILDELLRFWWLWAPVILMPLFHSTWMFWRQEIFKASIPWTLLELKIPREIAKSPRGMEQVLAAIHTLANYPSDFGEYWVDGEVTRWWSLEITSFSGEIRLYVRTPTSLRRMVEAAFFSYYPDVEVVEAKEDYVEHFPENIAQMREWGYDMWGTEMMLMKEEAYPIRTYDLFEDPAEEKQFDPMSTLIEMLGKTRPGEMVGVQFLITPVGPQWKDEFSELVEKLREGGKGKKKEEEASTTVYTNADFPGGPLPAFSSEALAADEAKPFRSFFIRTPGETEVLKAVEENLSKPAFETIIRLVYFSPKSIFQEGYARRGLSGTFNQYGALDLNRFFWNPFIATRVKIWYFPYLFPLKRMRSRQARLIYLYRHRKYPPHTFMGRVFTSTFFNWNASKRLTAPGRPIYKPFLMTTKCLATLFHPPTNFVLTAPHIRRMESRKVGAPAGLAIYGGEEELQKFQ